MVIEPDRERKEKLDGKYIVFYPSTRVLRLFWVTQTALKA